MMLRTIFFFFLLTSALWGSNVKYAVMAIKTEGQYILELKRYTDQFRKSLKLQRGLLVLSSKATIDRLTKGAFVLDPDTANSKLKRLTIDADFAYKQGDYKKAIREYTEAITLCIYQIENATDKWGNLVRLRMLLARSYMSDGQLDKARQVYRDVIAYDPGINLPKGVYSSKEIQIFETVRKTTLKERPASLSIASNPSRAEIYLDGKLRGKTPLTLDQNIFPGVFTLYVQKEGKKSLTHVIKLTEKPDVVQIDLEVEARIYKNEGPAILIPDPKEYPFYLKGLGAIFGVDKILVLKIHEYKNEPFLEVFVFKPSSEKISLQVFALGKAITEKTFDHLAAYIGVGKLTGRLFTTVAQVQIEIDKMSRTTVTKGKTPFFKTWWFWTIVGGVVAGGTVLGLYLGGVFNYTVTNQPAADRVINLGN